jgi:hypothetical protein
MVAKLLLILITFMGFCLCCFAQSALQSADKTPRKTDSRAVARSKSGDTKGGVQQPHSIEDITGWIINNSHISIEKRDTDSQTTIEQDLEKGPDECVLLVKTRWRIRYPTGEDIHTIEDEDIWTADLRSLSPDYVLPYLQKAETLYWIEAHATNKEKVLSHSHKRHTTFAKGEDLDESDQVKEAFVPIRATNEELAHRIASALLDGIKQCGGKSDAKDIY